MTHSLAVASAAGLGLLCATSPCPLVANIAAVSFLARRAGSPARVALAGLAHAAGRAAACSAMAAALAAGLAAAPSLSHALQTHGGRLAGPLLVLVAIVLLDLVPFRLPAPRLLEHARGRLAATGLAGAFGLGLLLALAMCPTSAALFFGGLVPLAVGQGAPASLAAVFGLASALPAVGVATALSLGVRSAAKAVGRLAAVDAWARRVFGLLLLLAGLWLTVSQTLPGGAAVR